MMNDIGWAVKQMWNGDKVRRTGWNGKGMFLTLVTDVPPDSSPFVSMWTAQQKWQPGWLCSQADLLAVDWELA
jgi:hypothetical protein